MGWTHLGSIVIFGWTLDIQTIVEAFDEQSFLKYHEKTGRGQGDYCNHLVHHSKLSKYRSLDGNEIFPVEQVSEEEWEEFYANIDSSED